MNLLLDLLPIMAVDLAAAATPGPAFLLVSRTALRAGSRTALGNVGGLLAANVVWCTAALTGLTALLALAPWLHTTLQVMGGIYLVWLGLSLWLDKADQNNHSTDGPSPSPLGNFGAGLLVGLSNPKAAIYFASIFALFIAPGTSDAVRAGAVGVVLFDTIAWYGFVAALFSRAAFRRAYARIRRVLDRIAGTLLAGLGLRLILVRD